MNHAGAAVLFADNHTGSILEHRVEVGHIHIVQASFLVAFQWNLWQQVGRWIALLGGYVMHNCLHFGCIDEGTLDADGLRAAHEEHVALADELVGACSVEDGLAVNAGCHLECHASREVGLDGAGDDVCCRALCGDNHVYADGSCQLCDAGNGKLYLLACRHDEVAEFVDDNNDVGHVAMPVVRVELAVAELLIILLDVFGVGFLQQVVAVVHLEAKALKRLNDLIDVCDNGLFLVLVAFHLSQEVVDDGAVEVELHLLRVNHNQLQLCRMLLVEQGCDDGVQSDGFTLSCSACHKQVRHLCEVGNEDFVGDGLAERHRQLVVGLLELAAVQYAFHRHHLRLGVRHFNADGSLAWNGRDDADAEGTQAQGNVVLQIANGADADAWSRRNFVERDGGTDGCLRVGHDFHAEVAQDGLDALLVVALLLHIDGAFCVVVVCEQVDGGVLIVLQVELRVVGLQGAAVREVCLLGVVTHDYGYIVVLACFIGSFQRGQQVVVEVNRSGGRSRFVGERSALFFLLLLIIFVLFLLAVLNQGIFYIAVLFAVLSVLF